jgi:hypothetical protein
MFSHMPDVRSSAAAAPAATVAHQVGEAVERTRQDYAPGRERPLGSYLVLLGSYGSLVGALAVGARAKRRRLPDRVPLGDIALLGVATHKVSRMLAKDPVFSSMRAPFARFEGTSGPAELRESPRGSGLRHALGELVTCPFCLGQWVATGFVAGMLFAPRATRVACSAFAVVTVSDTLQLAYSRMERLA